MTVKSHSSNAWKLSVAIPSLGWNFNFGDQSHHICINRVGLRNIFIGSTIYEFRVQTLLFHLPMSVSTKFECQSHHSSDRFANVVISMLHLKEESVLSVGVDQLSKTRYCGGTSASILWEHIKLSSSTRQTQTFPEVYLQPSGPSAPQLRARTSSENSHQTRKLARAQLRDTLPNQSRRVTITDWSWEPCLCLRTRFRAHLRDTPPNQSRRVMITNWSMREHAYVWGRDNWGRAAATSLITVLPGRWLRAWNRNHSSRTVSYLM